jgi:predicted amino acid racemase
MPSPSIAIDLDAITSNTRDIVAGCAARGVDVIGVTKATCGNPLVARAMLRGGVVGLGESRIDNVRRLRRNGLSGPIMMLRIPSISEAPDVVRLCDISLNSERTVLEALSDAARQLGRVHDVILMLERGDRREGASAAELIPLCDLAMAAPGLRLAGLGANFMCASGVLPTTAKLEALCAHAEAVEERFGIRLDYVSGGNSGNLPLMDIEGMPDRINQLRIGAAILRGENSVTGGTLPGLLDDAFTLEAELVEIKTKPSLPEGETGRDAFGGRPIFEDRGDRVRGIVNLGRVDIQLQGLSSREPDAEITAASSDHLIVDLTGAKRFAVGDTMRFDMDYGALLQAMLSPYVEKRLAERELVAPQPERLRLLGQDDLLARPEITAFLAGVSALGYEVVTGGVPEPDDLALWITRERDDAWSRAGEMGGEAAELGLLWIDAEPGPAASGPPETAALFGLRTATEAQAAAIHDNEMMAFTMEDVDLIGVREAMRRALHRVTATTDGFALVLHGSAARGTDTDPMEAGLSYRECSTAMELIAASQGLRAIVLSGFGPDSPTEALTAAHSYLLSALGKRILR